MTTSIKNVTVLGTGVLGSQIAYQTAYSGFDVTAYDISEKIVKTNRKRFEELAERYEREVEGARGGRAQVALGSIKYSWNLAEAVRDADLVIESAPERLDVKRDLYMKLAPLAPEKTIFATNSSTLLPSDLADATGRPDRFLALHFANTIWIHNIAEIMGHPGTDPAVYDTIVEFAQRIGMEPIKIHKEQPGYVVNSLLVPFLTAAQSLIANGVADPETIDKTWRIATGAPTGPLEILDVVGLNTAYNIAAAGDEQARANARYLKEHYIDQGKLGQASGEGFYKYDTAPQVRARAQAAYVSRPDAVVAPITSAPEDMKTEPVSRIDFANLPTPAEGFLVTLFITVRKVARSRDFYSRILGGTVVLDENPCMVRLSNSWIIMNPGGPPTPDKPDISVVPYEPDKTTSIFLNLRVADVQACYEEWKAKGAEFLTPPIDREAEIRCYMRDPDGYLIEVGQSTGLLQGKLAKKRPRIFRAELADRTADGPLRGSPLNRSVSHLRR